jgi:hypothetical protein
MENLRTPIDRAHRVVLGTGLERLEHLLKQIWEGFTRIPTGKTGIWNLLKHSLSYGKSENTNR